jgi:hypothetical protein
VESEGAAIMAFRSQYGGIKQVKGGHALALDKNEVFVANLTSALYEIPKRLVGALAATTLTKAIYATKHDSSRAGANWDLALFGENIRHTLSPSVYEQPLGFGMAIGKKGSMGANTEYVVFYKHMFYGIDNGAGGWQEPFKGGLLYDAIGIGNRTSIPKIELYNPIIGANPATARRSGGSHDKATYAFNAFYGGLEAVMPDMKASADQIGNGYLPHLIMKLNRALTTAKATGTFRK